MKTRILELEKENENLRRELQLQRIATEAFKTSLDIWLNGVHDILRIHSGQPTDLNANLREGD